MEMLNDSAHLGKNETDFSRQSAIERSAGRRACKMKADTGRQEGFAGQQGFCVPAGVAGGWEKFRHFRFVLED